MKIAIVGCDGYIAGFLKEAFEKTSDDILKIGRSSQSDLHLDLLHPEVFPYMELQGIDYILFTAAISSPDKCAKEYDLCWKINVEGTGYFIQKALEMHCRVLFFSSDAVFGSDRGGVFVETSVTKADTAYGKMKKYIEDKFSYRENFKAIRLSYVVSARDKFMSYCLACIKEKKEAEIIHPFYRNCISISDVVNVVCWMCGHWEDLESWVLNAAGNELVSRVRIADEINRYLDNQLNYKLMNPEKDFWENRPMITQMASLYLPKCNCIQQTSFTDKIREELEMLKK